jgi:CTP:molybdopterin cytidylyltransferase MocA
MGVPKGLLRLAQSGPAFIRIIADLYLNMGYPVDVVTTEELAGIYLRELPADENLRVLVADPGSDTALTLLVAWRSCLTAGISCSHFWAHPVDLPLVTAGSLNTMLDHSRRYPDRVIRPLVQGIPGHPVILPSDTLAILDGKQEWQGGPLRDFLFSAWTTGVLSEPVKVGLDDPGITQDFDRPGDLGLHRPLPENRGAK